MGALFTYKKEIVSSPLNSYETLEKSSNFCNVVCDNLVLLVLVTYDGNKGPDFIPDNVILL